MSGLTSYLPAFLGGVLIGTSAALVLLLLGRIAGISGIVANLLPPVGADWMWRAAFVLGLIGGPLLFIAVTGAPPEIEIAATPVTLVVAGLLVGFGTRLGSGCTSGHGVCGLARLSPRSIVAVATFMATAILTVFIRSHVL
ncbi:MAG: hypothetical protein BGO51_17795 [Rhodospirillales bacterium 69-11]|jgi:uncharacterized membrane protein YedE/YeeE|nr:YeeE/YedE family protein [Rhodospirillales bacterium]MBN8926710.1 YeeE/YedE family protein [Rhodospirillales bacterium]OJW20597.1 MAG: hypothetical protein BGO51_17795 [Rhodospirillales bacterium 69-11]